MYIYIYIYIIYIIYNILYIYIYIAKQNANLVSTYYHDGSNTQVVTRKATKFSFATVAMNCSNIYIGTFVFLIDLHLKLTYENIL